MRKLGLTIFFEKYDEWVVKQVPMKVKLSYVK